MSPGKLVVLAVLVGIGFWIALVAAILSEEWPGLFLNLGTEIMGAGLIYLVFDWFIGGRERREAAEREMEAHKKELIARMGSQVHDVAIEAVEELRRRGWLTDGSLQGKLLISANLEGANLGYAQMEGANLLGANLERARLLGANLERAVLIKANLRFADLRLANLKLALLTDANLHEAFLHYATLQEASLLNVDLSGAEILGTDLKGAVLRHANLKLAVLKEVRYNSFTMLPDGTYWSEDTDMKRFSDPNSPVFWDHSREVILELSAATSNMPTANETPDVS